MIIPALDRARRERQKRQLGLGDTFSALKDDDKDKTESTSARTTLVGSASSPSSSASITASSSRFTSSSVPASSSTASSSVVQASTAVETVTASLIFPNSFPPNFPVVQDTAYAGPSHGREYLFISSSKIGDSMLIFGASIAVLFLFSLILIKGSRVMDQRRGVVKVDGMVGDEMRWAEGREVIEKKIIYESVAERRAATRAEQRGPSVAIPGSEHRRRGTGS